MLFCIATRQYLISKEIMLLNAISLGVQCSKENIPCRFISGNEAVLNWNRAVFLLNMVRLSINKIRIDFLITVNSSTPCLQGLIVHGSCGFKN